MRTIRAVAAIVGWLLVVGRVEAASVVFFVDVPAYTEVEVCQYMEVEVGRPGDTLAGFRARLDGDSHHFHLFDATGVPPRTKQLVAGTLSECVDGDVVALVSADSPRVNVRFPPGVRLPWHGRQALVANYHVVNRSKHRRRMRARVHLSLRGPRPGDRLARRWGLPVNDMRVPPNSTAFFSRSTVLDSPLEFFMITGHMHSRGVMLQASYDGVPWYQLASWRYPSIARFVPPLLLPAGTTISVGCEFDNGVERPMRTCDGAPCDLISGSGVDDAMCSIAGYVLDPVSAGADTSAARGPRDTR